jgi:hypothetical protein
MSIERHLPALDIMAANRNYRSNGTVHKMDSETYFRRVYISVGASPISRAIASLGGFQGREKGNENDQDENRFESSPQLK